MSTAPSDPKALARRNLRIGVICAVVFAGMVGAAYASVPLYRAFCQVTGFDGTVRKAEAAPTRVLDRTLTIRFDANVRNLPWEFRPDQVSQEVKIGDTGLAFFRVTNNGKAPITGRATYGVTPEQAGLYFQKLECFCFSEQTLKPGERVEMPVQFFIDPAIADDKDLNYIDAITLSYTFYPAREPAKPLASVAKPGTTGSNPL